MKTATLERSSCPINECRGKISLARGTLDSGELACGDCGARYPVLAGVAILLPDPEGYILAHAKGISAWVDEAEIPKPIRREYREALRELEAEHIEEDLESARVNALYFMTHYLGAEEASAGVASPEIRELIRAHWERGPFAQVARWVAGAGRDQSLVELGCGVGGLAARVAGPVSDYLGVDSSFASVALARSLYLGEGKPLARQGLASDLVRGPLAREYDLTALRARLPKPAQVDFIVGDLELPPLRPAGFDACAVLNAIDMLHAPEALPALQKSLLKPGGYAIQSAPYIWHESVLGPRRARHFSADDSASAVEALYSAAGFRIEASVDHIPWIFFKHLRQVELYSVHALMARAS